MSSYKRYSEKTSKSKKGFKKNYKQKNKREPIDTQKDADNHFIETAEEDFENKPTSKTKLVAKYITGTASVVLIFALLIFLPQSNIFSKEPKGLPVMAETSKNTTQAVTQPYNSTETLSFEKGKYSVTLNKSVTLKVAYTPNKVTATTPKATTVNINSEVTNTTANKSINITKPSITQPKITWSTKHPDIINVDQNGKVTAKAVGQATVYAQTDTGIFTSCVVNVSAPKEHTIKDVPFITQMPEYPSGCESISTVMLLKYYGYNISADDFIDDYLPKGYFEDSYNGMTGPDTHSVFIGSPYSEDSLGCYPPVIEEAINKYISSLQKNSKISKKLKNKQAVNISGVSMQYLAENYISQNQPVLVWATMYMWQPVVTYTWTVSNSADYSPYNDGDSYDWLANEHCLVLVGYDEYNYYFNDPLYSYGSISYNKEIFEDRYEKLGKNAVILSDVT